MSTSVGSGWLRQLPEHEVHVWRVPLCPAPADLEARYAGLSSQERQRADRYMFAKDRNQLILSHHALNRLLQDYLGPDLPPVRAARHGKPELVGSRLRFNLSHARGLALVAFCWDSELGVDVEDTSREVDYLGLALRFFASAESSQLEAMPHELWRERFFLVWTRKEAYIKAIGDGLTHPLDRFQVSLDPERPRLLDCPDWALHRIRVPAGYEAALAVRDHRAEVRLFDFPG